MEDNRCLACKTRVKDWKGDDPKCGFKNGAFDGSDNWNCGTVSMLRNLVELAFYGESIPGILTQRCENDQNYATLNLEEVDILHDENQPNPVALWIGWYKSRGRTEGMYLMFENIPPRPPTERECVAIIKHYAKFIREGL